MGMFCAFICGSSSKPSELYTSKEWMLLYTNWTSISLNFLKEEGNSDTSYIIPTNLKDLMLSKTRQTQKNTYYLILLTGATWGSQIHRDRKQKGGRQRVEGAENGDLFYECRSALLPPAHASKFKMLHISVAFLIPPDLTTPPLPVVSISRRDYLERLSC